MSELEPRGELHLTGPAAPTAALRQKNRERRDDTSGAAHGRQSLTSLRANLARGVLDGAVLSTVSLCRAGSETFPCRQSRIDRRLARCLTSIGCAREWKKTSERRRSWSRRKRR